MNIRQWYEWDSPRKQSSASCLMITAVAVFTIFPKGKAILRRPFSHQRGKSKSALHMHYQTLFNISISFKTIIHWIIGHLCNVMISKTPSILKTLNGLLTMVTTVSLHCKIERAAHIQRVIHISQHSQKLTSINIFMRLFNFLELNLQAISLS